jgi:hypothetical protein
MDAPTCFLASFFQSAQEPFKILVVLEDMLPMVASRHDVARGPGDSMRKGLGLGNEPASHQEVFKFHNCHNYRTDPF